MIENAKGYYMYLRESGKLERAVSHTAKFIFIQAPLGLTSFVEREARTFILPRKAK